MNASIELILFDLGGVLVELRGRPIPQDWLPDDMRFDCTDFLLSETAKSFEKGLIDAQSFAESIKEELNIEVSPENIIQHFTDWPVGLFPGAHQLLKSINSRFRLAVLSNTNELHWPRITSEFMITHYFEKIFASHLLKMAKPELDIFKHVISELGVEPDRILFLDDNQNNIDAARHLGIHGIQVSGIQQAQKVLCGVGAIGD